MATINSNGITINTLQQWKALLEGIYKSVDPDWDVSTNTPDGQIIAAFAEMLTNADEAVLDSYHAADPDTAQGQALDAILALSNMQRQNGTYSVAVVQLSGVETTVVPAGTQIENVVTGIRWALDSAVVLGADATNANVTCIEIGAQTAGAGELTQIANPVSGLQSVNNSAPATLGRNSMTDAEARLFREATISNRASNNIDSIVSAVAAVDGVTTVRAYNNRTATIDSNGIPGHNFSVIVLGGADADIAQAIYNNLPPGPGMYGGSSPVTVVTNSEVTNNSESITFGRAVSVPLYVTVNLIQTGEFASGIGNQIAQALVDFSIGDLFDDEPAGFRKTGFEIAEDISSGLLHIPVNYVVGATGQGYVDSIFIGVTSSPGTPGTVVIDWNEIATLDAGNIVVSVT